MCDQLTLGNFLEFVDDVTLHIMKTKSNRWLILLLENGDTQVSSLDAVEGLYLGIVTRTTPSMLVTDRAAGEFTQLGLGIDGHVLPVPVATADIEVFDSAAPRSHQVPLVRESLVSVIVILFTTVRSDNWSWAD